MKISYHKRWDDNGTVYSQAVRVSADTISRLQDAIQAEIALGYPRKAEYSSTSSYAEIFLKPSKEFL